jgi:DNA-binding CsgD family transcriptional regulator
VLLGRESERKRLDGVLDQARTGNSAVLVIRGEPGVGKSALLRYATDSAAALGFTTLNVRGIESESDLPFANLADLIRPIRDVLAAIPPTQSAVLAGALALGPSVPGDRFAVCAATLSVLAAAAERLPLLVVVDDVQWLDASSAEALLFAARRLGTEGIAMLFGLREGEQMPFELDDFPSLELGGIDEAASIQLLTSARPAVADRVAIALHRAVRGNPLALVEIPALLTEAERSGVDALPEPLPAGPHLEHAFLRRVSALPKPSRSALLVAAASESGDAMILRRAFEHLGLAADALEPAESAGLIVIEGVEFRFRHPLIRSAVYQAADPVARREAHRALAAALDAELVADRRAWHLAAAASAPDESIASGLEDAAIRSQGRSGYGSAARALVRAAALSPSTFERGRRLLAAANACQLAGRPDDGLRLLDEALTCGPPERMRFEIEHLRAMIEILVSTPMVAHARLLVEAERVLPKDPSAAATLLAEATVPCFMAAELSLALQTARRGRALADEHGSPAPLLVNSALAEAMVLNGMAVEAGPLLDDCLRRAVVGDPETARQAQNVPFALLVVERYAEARGLVGRVVAAARSASAIGILPYGLAILADLDFRLGNLQAAYATGTESLQLANETGQRSASSYSLVTLARVEAAQGRDEDSRAHVRAANELARIHGLQSIFNYAGSVLGLLELGRGRPAEGLAHLEVTAKDFRIVEQSDPNLIQWQPDYIECLARTGRTGDATRELEMLEADAERTDGAWARATAARCRGFITQDTDHFRRALELHEASPSPFEVARTQLCYGETLRRRRHRLEARQVLREALNTFERLGAEPWALRAHNELAATGEKARKRGVSSTRDLTPQELQIALAVAQGATNREAAAQLFLSPKTVEAHLSSAYRKLGVRSRTELTRIFANETSASVPSKATTRLA